ncbi:MAG TPA: class I SAM-dependent methyltransferase [Patescibacteria group bacterium]|nr:class I SAM-dependent methyltransferase [Patescibacteria group bacterium]
MNPDHPKNRIEQTADKNVYTESISQWYDIIMEAGYYDHERVAESLATIFQGKKKILELGVGTGLLAAQMVKRGFEVIGIDFTEAMLRVAKQRLGNTAQLYEQNVTRLHLPETYEAAYSEGGVWYVTRDKDGGLFLESHLPNFDDNVRGMEKITAALEPGGLLALGIQSVHADFEGLQLKDGAVYSQKVQYRLPYIDKEYFVRQEDQLVAHQQSTYMRFSDEQRLHMLTEAGLKEIGVDESNRFLVLKKN